MSIDSKLKELGYIQKTVNKKELTDLTSNILKNIKIVLRSEFDPADSEVYSRIVIGESIILFNQEANEYYMQAVQLILNDPIYNRIISSKKLYSEYKKFVLEILPFSGSISDEDLSSKIDTFLKELRTSIRKYKVAMPVEHFELSDLPELTLGRVRLVPFSSLTSEYEGMSLCIENGDATKIWADAAIETQSDPEKAIRRGEYEISRIINLLRIYIPILFRDDDRKKIGLFEYKMKTHRTICINDGGEAQFSSSHLGPFGVYVLNRVRLDMLKENYCLMEISGILSKDPSLRSKLEKSIIVAVRWLGLGVDEDNISEKFIKYIIALECLLIEGSGDKTDLIAKRTAFILGGTTEDCVEIETEVRSLYGIRSIIVHQGIDEETEEKLEETTGTLYTYTLNILLDLTKKTIGAEKWDSINCIDEEMNKKTYSR